jgi:hypothetical protein
MTFERKKGISEIEQEASIQSSVRMKKKMSSKAKLKQLLPEYPWDGK